MRTITCTNNNKQEIVFREDGFTPFLLAHVDGLYSSANEISVTENAVLDGGDYQGSRIRTRNIVLIITDKPGMKYAQKSRDILRNLFVKGMKGTLTYNEDGDERVIDYYVESITPGETPKRLYTISLICPDPYFYDKSYTNVDMATWVADFQFDHEFKREGEEIGHKVEERLVNIVGITPNPVGMIITLTANGEVINPTIINVTTSENMTVGTDDHPFTMKYGDVLTFITEDGKKNLTLTRDNETESINHYITEDSEFFQIKQGDNYIGYNAKEGIDNISLQIRYRNRYEGA